MGSRLSTTSKSINSLRTSRPSSLSRSVRFISRGIQNGQKASAHIDQDTGCLQNATNLTIGPITRKMTFSEPSEIGPEPSYRVLDPLGQLVSDLDPDLTAERIIELYRGMVFLNSMDKVMFDSQRQGRISFYMTSFGEEAASFGTSAALSKDDWVFAQYREPGILLQRQMDLDLMVAQCYGNKEDLGKGRQMPIHYGNRALNYVTISSPLATQMPQAVGSAFSFKKDKTRIAACYFGEGAASEGDAHAAFNFAATLECPVLFICRNNGYAISTPTNEQFRGDGIITRALGYGIAAIRVDGNDLFATYAATKAARQIAIKQSRPVLIELMTYRVGHHSTSDDSSAYRKAEEVQKWDEIDGPIGRVNRYLRAANLWSDDHERRERDEARKKVIAALNRAEKIKRLPVISMFDDVYDELPNNLKRQRDELVAHLDEFKDQYPMGDHED